VSRRVLILVEGQTEERFVKDILAPLFLADQLYLEAILLTTKRAKNGMKFGGGVTSFAKIERDIKRLIHGSGDALVTTLIDYYGLPKDFPGMIAVDRHASALASVIHLEDALAKHFSYPKNFLPFLFLHEFEALLFSNVDVLPEILTMPEKSDAFSAIRHAFTTPEDINNHPNTAPSKRILKLFPSYRKTLHGPHAVKRIGLATIQAECPHFAAWMNQLRSLAK